MPTTMDSQASLSHVTLDDAHRYTLTIQNRSGQKYLCILEEQMYTNSGVPITVQITAIYLQA